VTNAALALLSGLLLVLAFPRFDWTWLAPFALAPLLIAAARERSPWRRFLIGEAAGILYWFGVCRWIQFVLAVHGGMGEAGGWGVFALFCLAKSLHMAIFTTLAGWIMPHWWAAPAIAALWTGMERTHSPAGFAWLALGNAGIDMGVPMRLAPVTGVYGLSFVFALMAACVALLALRRPRRQNAWLLLLPLLYALPELPARRAGSATALLAQPNFALGDIDYERAALSTIAASLDPASPPPDLILWPEVPAPIYYYQDAQFRETAHRIALTARAPFLFGTVAYTSEGAPLNSAVMLSGEGEFVSRYDKIRLVPFGEFVPAPFGFVNRITQEAGDFAAGSEIVVSPARKNKLGAFICYESAFPHLVREFARDGAQLLVNLSNDGYFARTAAREQHLSLARMRAAENRRWLLRPTNNGITAAIDPAGRLAQRAPEFEPAAVRMQFDWTSGTTPYTRWGDWFAWLCLAAGLGAAAVSYATDYAPGK
jgi:apolipoprotein N-acyltransferase